VRHCYVKRLQAVAAPQQVGGCSSAKHETHVSLMRSWPFGQSTSHDELVRLMCPLTHYMSKTSSTWTHHGAHVKSLCHDGEVLHEYMDKFSESLSWKTFKLLNQKYHITSEKSKPEREAQDLSPVSPPQS